MLLFSDRDIELQAIDEAVEDAATGQGAKFWPWEDFMDALRMVMEAPTTDAKDTARTIGYQRAEEWNEQVPAFRQHAR